MAKTTKERIAQQLIQNLKDGLGKAGTVVREQVTDLGAAFLPTARGAELPLPSQVKITRSCDLDNL